MLQLTWFKNGQRIRENQRIEMTHLNTQATLKIRNATSDDSGHYSLLVENPQGCTVSSAFLAIESGDQVDNVLMPTSLSQQVSLKASHMEVITHDTQEKEKVIAPNFTRTCSDRDVTEGKMTR